MDFSVVADSAPVADPKAYPDWHHVKSMVINPGHTLHDSFGGLHHLYVNKAAITGYRAGKCPNGAVIVCDLLDAKAADNTVTESASKVLDVMHLDARKYASTGGCGDEGFKGDTSPHRAVGGDTASACHNCRVAQKTSGLVFSELRQ
jgi:hypothetical protein